MDKLEDMQENNIAYLPLSQEVRRRNLVAYLWFRHLCMK